MHFMLFARHQACISPSQQPRCYASFLRAPLLAAMWLSVCVYMRECGLLTRACSLNKLLETYQTGTQYGMNSLAVVAVRSFAREMRIVHNYDLSEIKSRKAEEPTHTQTPNDVLESLLTCALPQTLGTAYRRRHNSDVL